MSGPASSRRRIPCACSLVAVLVGSLLAAPLRAQDEASVETLAAVLAVEDARRFDGAVLFSAARHPAAAVRRYTARAMGRIGSRAATPTLLELLQDPDTIVQQDAAFALGLLADPAALPRLRDLVLNVPPDQQTGTHAEAVAAVARMGGPDGAALVADLLGRWAGRAATADAPLAVRAAVGDAWRLGAAAPVAAILPFVESPIWEVQWRAVYSLARLQAPEAASVLLQATNHREPLLRSLAIRALTARYADTSGLDRDALATRARRLATDPDPQVRINALRTLGTFRRADYAETAIDRLGDGDVNVRVQAVLALADLGGPRAGPALRSRVNDRVFAIRHQALVGLARTEGSGALAEIGPWVVDRDPLVRRIAAEALGATGSDSALSWLETLARDPDGRVAHPALTAIAGLRPIRGAALARELLRHADPVVRRVAADRLAERPDTALITPLVDAYGRSLNPEGREARIAIVGALGRIAALGFSQRIAVEDRFLTAFPTCDDYLVRRAAALRFPAAAERWGPERPVETGRQIGDYRDIARSFALPGARGGGEPTLVVETDRGSFTVALFPGDAPITIWSLLLLVDRRYFDGGTWHRVVPNFVIQDGDPRGDGQGGPGFRLRDENSRRRYERGVVGMALSGPDTGGSQFFVTVSPQPHLDGTYPVIGRVLSGMEVVDRISQGERIRRIRRP